MTDPRMISNMSNHSIPFDRHENGRSILPLPLNLIALIISYLDRPSDLARMCRTCRVFHYMTLPQLYVNVSLQSYDHIRYSSRDGRPEGCGMASPFSMGLNGLVSRNVAGYVRNFEVCGEWKEHDVEANAKVGRVPDETMLMNILVRVAMERMAVLNSFSWLLNSKMLPTVWQGLAQKNTLTRLTVKFPTNRQPRPITMVPPIPSLVYLKVFDIDPLCYADDISVLLLGSKKLQDLILHWSPRMREAREPSVNTLTYMGKVLAAQYSLPLRSIAIQNLYTHRNDDCARMIDLSKLEEMTCFNSTGGFGNDGANAFMESPACQKSEHIVPYRLKMLRMDRHCREQCDFLAAINGLERLYLVGPQASTRASLNGSTNTTLPQSPPSTLSSPSSAGYPNTITSLKEDYLEAITKKHGRTLRHLLLLPQWRLTNDEIALIVRSCPNLEQLAIGADFCNFSNLRLLMPFLPNLTALRILGNPDDPTFTNLMRDLEHEHERKISEETITEGLSKFRWIELGSSDLVYELMKRETVDIGGGKTVRRPLVRRRPYEMVQDYDIWKMDSLDI